MNDEYNVRKHMNRREQIERFGSYKSWWLWLNNEQLLEHSLYKHGTLLEYKDWHQNGKLWRHSFYNNGKYHGERKCWNSNGSLWAHCLYEHGQKIISFL